MSHTTANAPASPASPPTTGGAGTSPSGQVTTNKAVNSQWTITLFGTAVGAGILFLPISAGSFGFVPLLVATLLIFPMTYLAHRAFSWIISYSPLHGEDVLAVLTHFFGRGNGIILAIIYWFTIFPVVLIYGVSITNTVDSFIVNQLGGPSINRWILSIACVGVMTGLFAIGRRPMLWLAQMLVYPLIIALAVTSIYLIPRWDLHSFIHYDDGADGLAGRATQIRPLPSLVEGDDGRLGAHQPEKGIGREVVAQPAAGRDPADRARGDDGVPRVVGQAVAGLGAVEHRQGLLGATCLDDGKTGILKDIAGIHAD